MIGENYKVERLTNNKKTRENLKYLFSITKNGKSEVSEDLIKEFFNRELSKSKKRKRV